MRQLLKLMILAGLSQSAGAATVTAPLTTEFTVLENCVVVAAPTFVFTDANPAMQADWIRSATVTVACTEGLAYHLDATDVNLPVDFAGNAGGMQLFRDSGLTTTLHYDGVTHTGAAQTGTGLSQDFTIYGRLTGYPGAESTVWWPIPLAGGAVFSGTISGALILTW